MRSQSIGCDCLKCSVRGERSLCALSLSTLKRLNKVTCRASYPAGARLFDEGQPPRGVFVLCTGTAKLWTSSSNGKTIITRIAHSGDVLGLNAVISARPYGVSAEMTEPGQANFIVRDSLLQLMRDHSEVAARVGEQLSAVYYTAHEEVRTLGLTTHPAERLAKLLLSWTTKARESNGGDDSRPVKLTLNQEEIGETIGVTRQTVTRLLSEFSKRQILQLRRSVLWIQDRPALEKISQL